MSMWWWIIPLIILGGFGLGFLIGYFLLAYQVSKGFGG